MRQRVIEIGVMSRGIGDGKIGGELGGESVIGWNNAVVTARVEGALITWFDDVVEFQVRGWRVGKSGWREHEEVCDWVGEVGELNVVFPSGYVPRLDLAVLVAGEEAGAVVADLEGEGGGRRGFGKVPAVGRGRLGGR